MRFRSGSVLPGVQARSDLLGVAGMVQFEEPVQQLDARVGADCEAHALASLPEVVVQFEILPAVGGATLLYSRRALPQLCYANMHTLRLVNQVQQFRNTNVPRHVIEPLLPASLSERPPGLRLAGSEGTNVSRECRDENSIPSPRTGLVANDHTKKALDWSSP